MRSYKHSLTALLAGFCLTLVACSEVPSEVDQNMTVAGAKADQLIKTDSQAQQAATPDTYLGPTQAMLSSAEPEPELPEVFNKSYNLVSPNPMTLGEIAANLQQNLGLTMYVEPEAINEIGAVDVGATQSIDGQQSARGADATGGSAGGSAGASVPKSGYKFQLMYTGTVKGLLDNITSRANVFWSWDPNQRRIDIYRQRIRHFEIHALVGAYDYASSVSNSSGTQAGTTSGTGTSNGVTGTSQSDENTALKAATIDVWKSITADVKSMLSTDGVISPGDSVGYLTVKDTPSRLQTVEQYVAQLNQRLSHMVAVRVDVIDVSIDHAENYGIDWNAVYTKAGSYGVSLVTNTLGGSIGNTLTGTVLSTNSRWSTTKAILAALNTQADASIVTSEELSTQSGMPAPVKVAKETTYLASVTQTDTSNVGTSATLTPGTVTAGTTMMILPFVENDGHVMVQLSMDISTLDGIDSVSSGGNIIQTPHLSVKNFLERLNVRSGQTIVVSGFQQAQDSSKYSGVTPGSGFFAWLGGLFNKEHVKTTTVVLITPYIIQS